jgi:hypothetical protein
MSLGSRILPFDVTENGPCGFIAEGSMSALPSKADMCSALVHVRFGPKADINHFSERRGMSG